MDPLARRAVGRSVAKVTQMGFGGAPIGGFRFSIHPDEARGCVRTAYDAGIRYLDTSPFYGYGRSEMVMGEVLRHVPRESFVLSTKIGRVMTPLRPGESTEGLRPHGLPFRPAYDYSYDGVMRSLEHSALRTGIGYPDIVYIHDVDMWTLQDSEVYERHFRQARDGAMKALVELRAAGVIKAIGAGLNEIPASLRFAAETDIDVILLASRYTLLEQTALAELIPLCRQRGISLVIGGPYNTGILATGVTENAKWDYGTAPDWAIQRVRALQAVCARHGVPLPAAALQFPLACETVASVIPGAISRAELLANIDHMRTVIPADFWAEIRREGLVDEQAVLPYC